MTKKNLKRIALSATLLGMFGAASAFAVVEDNQRELDIIIRDFDVSHPDFENFQEEAYFSLHTTENGANPKTWIDSYAKDEEWQTRRKNYDSFGCGNTQTPQYGIPVSLSGYPYQEMSAVGTFSTAPEYIRKRIEPSSGYAWYGEFSNCKKDAKLNPLGLNVMRGLVADLCTNASGSWSKNQSDNSKSCSNKICETHNWSQIVYTTPGMVMGTLTFPVDSTGALDMYEPVISRNNYACDNLKFEEWFTGDAHRSNATMILDQDPANKSYFEIDKNWNNGGYFPLDSVEQIITNGKPDFVWRGSMGQFKDNFKLQYGAQSLSIFCPPYQYRYANTQKDFLGDETDALCQAWKKAGGPRVGSAATNATLSDSKLGLRHLRNYNFTMMGYAAFKYKKGKGEIFEFTGDDDMWIYVDGVLVVDLGGTHLAAQGKVEMDYLSKASHGCHPGEPLQDSCSIKLDADGSWLDGSWHHLHFFYADRQTDGSNLRIRSSLSELAPSRYGQPSIGNVTVKVDEEGNQTTSILLNTVLSEETVTYINNLGSAQPTMVVMRNVTDPVTGVTTVKTFGYYVNNIQGPVDKGPAGKLYTMSGTLKDAAGNVVEGGILGNDMLAFNSPYDPAMESETELETAYNTASQGLWEELLAWNKRLEFTISSGTNKPVVGYPDTPDDWAVVKFFASIEPEVIPPDSVINRPDFVEKSNQLTQIAEQNGGELPVNASADLIMVNLPEGVGKLGNPLNLTEAEAKALGAAGEGGAPGLGAKIYAAGDTAAATSVCFSENGVESCPSWYFAMSGPFSINIRVFDNLGHFVNQYQQEVDETAFKRALGGENSGTVQSSCMDENKQPIPMYGNTGVLLAAVKMYPVSQNGRTLGTGPYIYQVTVVQKKYTPCINKGQGQITVNTVDYSRTYDVYTRGYRRKK